MRLVHAITSVDLRLGGTARAALDLVQAMTRREHQVTLLTNDASDVPQSWIGGGNPQSLLDPGLASYLVASRPSAATVEAVRDADVVHIHAMWEPFNARIATLCRKIGTPYVLTPHGMLDDWCMARGAWKKRVYLKLFGRQMLESAAFVHCTARAEL
ncbi:MAG: glycosyltransferase, partial [Phycisphaerales bacterium]